MPFTTHPDQKPSDPDPQTTYWTFERDGEIFDAEFDSEKEAQYWADEAFTEECEDEGGWDNGDTASADIELIEFTYDDDGEMVIKQRVSSSVDFEYYHGDLAEHGTWHKGGGGVL